VKVHTDWSRSFVNVEAAPIVRFPNATRDYSREASNTI
jgi:hypothetical protein